MNYVTVRDIIFNNKLDKKEIASELGVTNIWLAHYLNGNRELTEEQKERLKELLISKQI